MIKQLERDLKEYEKIFLATGLMAHVAREHGISLETEDRILILSSDETGGASSPTVSFRKITAEEEKDLIRLYHTYEFSDRFRLITDTDVCGNLWNYVRTGVLARDEALRAMFT